MTWIVGAREGAVVTGGLTALGAGLYSLGNPKDSVLEYETAVKSGNYVLVTHGTPEDVAKAKSIVEQTDAKQLLRMSADTSLVAAHAIWIAALDWGAKNPKATKTRMEKAKAALQEVVKSGSNRQFDQAEHLIGMIDAIDVVK